ncbi:SpoIIE family protein phosphatase [Aneurinibacillus terranovensis]|uniref:SpoIIE family protein phosphatase n=1 Tax=Aneurinibacillus terranovensis TaxID=278991 RepID=UPI0003FE3D33|nr:SpoIIE family protein phosphatase [Aneurinibacillus terranovensis]
MRKNINWRYLIFLCAFQGWVLTNPLFGTILATFASKNGIEPTSLVHPFLLVYSLSFAFWGILFAKVSLSARIQNVVLSSILVTTIGLNLSCLWVSPGDWKWVFAIVGLLSSYPSFIWLNLIRQRVHSRYIGWNLGVTGFFIESTVYIINILSENFQPLLSFLLFQGLILVAFACFLSSPALFVVPQSSIKPQRFRKKDNMAMFVVLFFIYIIFLEGGLMYQVINPYLQQFPKFFLYYTPLPYTIAMPLAGFLGDKKGIRPITLFGLVLLGGAYAIFAISHAFPAAVIGTTAIRVSFAFLDFFVLFVLAKRETRWNTMIGIGVGLCVYNGSILSGSWFSRLFLIFSDKNSSIMIYLLAILIIFLSFLCVDWVNRREIQLHLDEQGMEKDLQAAQQVQRGMLPKVHEFPQSLEISVCLHGVKKVTGDFYDVIFLSPTRHLLVIGDIMGHGLAPALLVSSLLSNIRSESFSDCSPKDILQKVNRYFIRDVRSSMFVTIGLALVDQSQQTITYAGAGHPFPYLIKKSGVQEIDLPSIPVGVDEQAAFEQQIISVQPHDILVLYTDGLIEGKNEKEEIFGFERFHKLLQEINPADFLEKSSHTIMEAIQSFCTDTMEDDCTLVMVRSRMNS